LVPRATLFYPQSTAIVGDRLFTIEHVDEATRLQLIYYIGAFQNVRFRCLLI